MVRLYNEMDNHWRNLLLWLLVLGAVGVASAYWAATGFERNEFFAMLTFLANVLLVYVTARYVLVVERDAATRQRVQEEWETRRFYAGRTFAIADGCVDVFFAAKHELEIFITEWDVVERFRQDQLARINPLAPDGVAMERMVNEQVGSRLEQARVRYNERAKDYNWRAQGLLYQARELLAPEQVEVGNALFLELSADFHTLDEGKAVLAKYTELFPQVSGFVASAHRAADSKLRVRQ